MTRFVLLKNPMKTPLLAFLCLTASAGLSPAAFEGEFSVRLDTLRPEQPPKEYLVKGRKQWVTTYDPLHHKPTRILLDFREMLMGFVLEHEKVFAVRAMVPPKRLAAPPGTEFFETGEETEILGHRTTAIVETRPDGTKIRRWISFDIGELPSMAFHPRVPGVPDELRERFPSQSLFPLRIEELREDVWVTLVEVEDLEIRDVSDGEMEAPEGFRTEIVGFEGIQKG